MSHPLTEVTDQELQEAQKRVRKIKRFYKGLAQWAGVSIFMIALDLFLSGGISWSKYPVFFWGIAIIIDFFEVMRLQRHDKDWERKQLEKQLGRKLPGEYAPLTELPKEETKDYSEELLNKEQREREAADLSEVRKLKRPWKDEDLV